MHLSALALLNSIAFLLINGAAKSPAKEYNNDAGDLNKKDVLKALYPTADIPKKEKTQL
jgi:hypothetical protein